MNVGTIKDRLSRAGISPCGESGGYNVYPVRESLRALFTPDTSIDIQIEKARLTKAQADKEELGVALAESSQVQAHMVKSEWLRLLGAFRSKLLNIPAKLSPVLLGAEIGDIQKILEGELHDALTELSLYEPSAGVGSGSGADTEAAPEADD